MSDQVMLECSMLLHRDSANYLLALNRDEPLDVVVATTVLRAASSEPELFADRLADVVGVPRFLIDLAVTRQLARQLEGRVKTYSVPATFQWPSGPMYEAVSDELSAAILHEEFAFLITESWLFSKTRDAFDKMVEAGGKAVQFSKNEFDRSVRKVLKKGPNEPLSKGHLARATAKWIAVGGPAVIGVLEPISGAAAGTLAGMFFLHDP